MATVRIPSSLQAQMTRSAISPRLATSSFRNIGSNRAGPLNTVAVTVTPWKDLVQPESEKRLAVFDRLAVGNQALHHFAGAVRFDLVHQLHGFDDAQHLAVFDRVPYLDKGGRTRRGRLVERAHDRRLDDVQFLFFDQGRWDVC